jgi:hypothetical protein
MHTHMNVKNIHCRTESQGHCVIDSALLSVGPVFETPLFPPALCLSQL